MGAFGPISILYAKRRNFGHDPGPLYKNNILYVSMHEGGRAREVCVSHEGPFGLLLPVLFVCTVSSY